MEQKFKEAIENHKKKGITTYTLTCETGEACVIREPSVTESGKIVPMLVKIGDNEPDFIGAGKLLVNNCWVAGDDKIRKDDDLLAEIAFAAISIIKLKVADVKKN